MSAGTEAGYGMAFVVRCVELALPSLVPSAATGWLHADGAVAPRLQACERAETTSTQGTLSGPVLCFLAPQSLPSVLLRSFGSKLAKGAEIKVAEPPAACAPRRPTPFVNHLNYGASRNK